MTLSTHVLDTASGRPAPGITVELSRWTNGVWAPLATGTTDAEGRLREWAGAPLRRGLHQLIFGTGRYFAERRVRTLYPYVTVVFDVSDEAAHYHIPLLLSPYGYSTYRGS